METAEKPIKKNKDLLIFNELKKQGFSLKRIASLLGRNDKALSNIKSGIFNFSDALKDELDILQIAINNIRASYHNDYKAIGGREKKEEDALIINEYKLLIEKDSKLNRKNNRINSKILNEEITKLENEIKEKEETIALLTKIIKGIGTDTPVSEIIDMFAKKP